MVIMAMSVCQVMLEEISFKSPPSCRARIYPLVAVGTDERMSKTEVSSVDKVKN